MHQGLRTCVVNEEGPLSCQSESQEVVLGPPDVRDHGSQRTNREGVARAVVRDHHPTAVLVAIDMMAATGPCEAESVVMQHRTNSRA